MAPGISIGSLYCNTILANLNARTYLWGGEAANIVDVELFTGSSVQLETTKADRPDTSGEATLVTSQQVRFTILTGKAAMCLSDGRGFARLRRWFFFRMPTNQGHRRLYALHTVSPWVNLFMYISRKSVDFIYEHPSVSYDSNAHGPSIQTHNQWIDEDLRADASEGRLQSVKFDLPELFVKFLS